jgi:hypothetical protein
MKPVSAELLDLVNQTRAGTAQFFDFALVTITPVGAIGQVLRFTNADFDIVFGGNTWSSQSVRFDEKSSRALAHWKEGFDSDTWTLVTMPRALDPVTGQAFPDAIGGVPWLAACRGGVFDNADCQVDWALFSAMPTWPMAIPPRGAAPLDVVTGIFAGIVAEVDISDVAAILNVQDYRSLLSIQMPRNLFQGQCRHTLFDAGCQLAATGFRTAGTAIGGSTPAAIANTLGAPGGSGTYVLGTITITSGFNRGFSRIITSWAGPGQPFGLMIPFPFAVVSGDTFTATPGCNKTQAACTAFANIPNFGGQPYVPTAETAY